MGELRRNTRETIYEVDEGHVRTVSVVRSGTCPVGKRRAGATRGTRQSRKAGLAHDTY